MHAPPEPALGRLAHPAIRYFAATRPAFLSVTIVGCLLGFASAAGSGRHLDPVPATLTLFFALVAHAGANVLNDYYDALSGCDAGNTRRVFPFTGGSRFIQNGVLSLRATRLYGYALLATVIPAGLYLAALSDARLIGIGIAGLTVAWAYSAPPFQLQARGLGEFGITGAWLLVVSGADFVQRHAWHAAPVVAGIGFALLVANVLYINQFPDMEADDAAGKRTVVVRFGRARARWGYVLIALLGYGWVACAATEGWLPYGAWLSLAPAAASFAASRILWRYDADTADLAPAIKLTIAAAVAHGLLLAAALVLTS